MLSMNLPLGALIELLYAGDLILMSETIEGLWNMFLRWKMAFESKGLIASLGRTKVMVCDSITKDGMSKIKVDPCGVSRLRLKAKSDLCVQCGKWIYCRCAGVKRIILKFS